MNWNEKLTTMSSSAWPRQSKKKNRKLQGGKAVLRSGMIEFFLLCYVDTRWRGVEYDVMRLFESILFTDLYTDSSGVVLEQTLITASFTLRGDMLNHPFGLWFLVLVLIGLCVVIIIFVMCGVCVVC